MRKMMYLSALVLWAVFVSVGTTGCGSEPDGPGPDTLNPAEVPVRGGMVRIRIGSEPDNLNPLLSRHANATYIKFNVFQYLLNANPDDLSLVPQLAESRPEIPEDGLRFTFRLRDEATWDNGSPVTAEDVIFSFKAQLNPAVDAAHSRVYYDNVIDVVADPNDPKKFTIVTDKPNHRAEHSVGGMIVFPKYFYDPEGNMDGFTIADIRQDPERVRKMEGAQKFAEKFNSSEFGIDPAGVSGSGPYKVAEWTPGQRIVLKRKDDWYGDKVDYKNNPWFEAWPDELIYAVIPDPNTAVNAVKSEEIDVMNEVKPDEFRSWQDGQGIVPEKFELLTGELLTYTYLSMNIRPSGGRPPVLEDKRVRRAMAHLLDMDMIIEKIYQGYGKQAVTPISPLMKDEYHTDLAPIKHDLEKAAALLSEAGWEDTDGDGIRDKMINGRKVPLHIEILLSSRSETGRSIVRHMTEEGGKVGVDIELVAKDFRVILDAAAAHDYDMFGASLSQPPMPSDLRQLFACDSWLEDGSNYGGYCNPEADSLMRKIVDEVDAAKRKPMLHRLQEILYDDQPVLMLINPEERFVVHKRYRNISVSGLRPGVHPNRLWVPVTDRIKP